MVNVLRRLMLLVLLLAASACNKDKDNPPAAVVIPLPTVGPPTPIGAIMAKLTKGPQSLTPVIGSELRKDPPPWDTIQAQTKEFAQLASSMTKLDPPKGSKESWAKLSMAYADSAAALDKAALAKDKQAALAAHQKLASSCMECHREHRGPPAPMPMPK